MEIPGYSDLREIGRGGMARVYLARQESLSRNVALKVLNKFDKPTDAQRFLNEAHLIAALDHRNIITIHDIGTLGERHYIAMEYLAGGDLEKRLTTPIEVSLALEIVRVIGACLAFVHDQGVIHRDIKPANILFHTDGTPILTDFGIAKHDETDAHLTMDGTAVGSPYYLSPEQANANRSTAALTFAAWAWCSMKCSPGASPSRAARTWKHWSRTSSNPRRHCPSR